MIAKTKIVEHLGQEALVLPLRIAEALAANDRAKIRMTVLQAALARARDPLTAEIDLSREAAAVGLDAAGLRDLMRGAGRDGDDRLHAPGLGGLAAGLADDVEAMVATVECGEASEASTLRERWAQRCGDLDVADDAVAVAAVGRITSPAAAGGDSVHRLVMDCHRALDRLAAARSEEIVAGAHCSGLRGDDRRAVTAFMNGLARTRALKFDHPGLDTTAARLGDRLVVQNDIGTTDAHVVCISVDPEAVALTYSDVHRPRARFFVALLRDVAGVEWSEPTRDRADDLAEGESFTRIDGRLDRPDRGARDAFLEAIGAALVFLIDWNKARKQLRRFVDKDAAIEVLDWAARRGHGHRAFLELGGADLVDGAIQRAAAGHIAYGVRLDRAIGRDQAVDFLRQVLRVSAEGLLAGRADRLVRDAVDAELAGRLERSGSALLQGVVQQAGLARSIVAAMLEHLADRAGGRAGEAAALAEAAKRIEAQGDRLALDLRASAERYGLVDELVPLVDTMEQAIDELEEGVFFLSVIPPAPSPDPAGDRLAALCETAMRSAEAVARMADAASCVPDGHRIDVDDALAALADLFAFEHGADDLERATIVAVLGAGASAERIFAVVECARRAEVATDRFARAGHLLRAHVIGDLETRGRDAAAARAGLI